MEELDFETLLSAFDANGFDIGERVLLGHLGTVQTMLALIFNQPVRVRLVGQWTRRSARSPGGKGGAVAGEIVRRVDLVAGENTVCRALSHIPLAGNKRADVIRDVRAGRIGLGQIISKHQIPNKRSLLVVGRDDKTFWRAYEIRGPGLFLKILEAFPKAPFVDIGWLPAGPKANADDGSSRKD